MIFSFWIEYLVFFFIFFIKDTWLAWPSQVGPSEAGYVPKLSGHQERLPTLEVSAATSDEGSTVG